MSYEKFDLEITGGVARITMSDSSNYNTVNLQYTREFAGIARTLDALPDIRLVVLRAEGPVFSFGGDINEFVAKRTSIKSHVREMASHFHAGLLTLKQMRAPLIVAVNGTAAGGGFSLACCADMAVAKRSAKFSSAYTRSGLTPDGGSTFFLPRLVGLQRAFDLMATNPTLSAQEALELGIIARVFEDDTFEQDVEGLVKQLISLPSDALAGLKSLLNASPVTSLAQQFELEGQSISSMAATDDTMATLEKFLNR